MANTAEQQRRADLAKIHIAKKDLGLSEDVYQDILYQAGGVESSADLKPAGRRAVLARFRELGWKPRGKGRQTGGRKLADDPRSRKIRALWIELHQAGKVKDPSEDALLAFVHRLTRRKALQWLTPAQASTVIEALKGWLDRDQDHQEATHD